MVIERIGAIVPRSGSRRWRVALCVLVMLGALVAAGVGLRRVHAQQTAPPPHPADQAADGAADAQNGATAVTPAADEKGGVAAQGPAPETPADAKPAAVSSPEQQRKQEVATQCANLLKMATDLKTEVDKTTKDELSLAVVRKAGELEQFARKVRGDPRLTAGKE